MFISTSTTGPHEGNLRAERIRILVHKFCVRLVETFGGAATRAPRRKVHFVVLFSEILNEIVYLKCALAICKTCQFITLPRSGDFQFAPFQWI